MAPINTRSHIVLDKESMKKYAASMGAMYTGIFEIDLKEECYNTLFCTNEIQFISQDGTAEDFMKSAMDHIHPEDLKTFFSTFGIESLRRVLKQNEPESVEFRCFSPGSEYQWVRILITPDEVEKDRVLCFISDIHAQKRCEMLEEQNVKLTTLLTRLYNSNIKEADRFRDHIRGIAEYQNLTAAALR